MATQQVKFYSMASDAFNAAGYSADPGGIYFVQGGELYKGGERFGLGRVTVDAAFVASTSSKEGQKRGDIVVTGSGAGWVYVGAGANEGWQSIGGDIASLQSMWQADISTWTKGLVQNGSGSYITGITQGADGKVTAQASNFATDVKTAVGNGSASGAANGITVSVVTTSGSVTSVSVDAANLDVTSISATTGSFGVIYLGNTDASVNEVVTSIGPSTGDDAATDSQLPTAKAVRDLLNNLDNAMHFREVVASTGAISDPEKGDIVVIGANPTGGAVTGQEYIYDGTKWELIGDQNTYAVNAYTSNATVYAGVETVPGALNAAGAAIDALKSKTAAFEGGTSTSTDRGVTETVVIDAATLAPTVTTAVSLATMLASAKTDGVVVTAFTEPNDTTIPTTKAVADAITAAEVAGGTSTSTVSGIGVEVVTASTTAAPSVTVTVNTTTLSTALGLGTAAFKDATTTVAENGTDLPTAGAVDTAIKEAIAALDSTVSNSDKGVFMQVVETDGKLTGATVTVTAASQMAFNAEGDADELATTAAVRDFYDNNLVWLGATSQPITVG